MLTPEAIMLALSMVGLALSIDALLACHNPISAILCSWAVFITSAFMLVNGYLWMRVTVTT